MNVWDKLASGKPIREKPVPKPTPETIDLRNRIVALYRQENLRGRIPRVREVGKVVGLSSNSTVLGHLRAIVADGRLLHDEINGTYYLATTPLAEALAILREFEPMANHLPEPTRTQLLNLLEEFPKDAR